MDKEKIDEFVECAKKCNVSIITATQMQRPNPRIKPLLTGPIFIDYVDILQMEES